MDFWQIVDHLASLVGLGALGKPLLSKLAKWATGDKKIYRGRAVLACISAPKKLFATSTT